MHLTRMPCWHKFVFVDCGLCGICHLRGDKVAYAMHMHPDTTSARRAREQGSCGLSPTLVGLYRQPVFFFSPWCRILISVWSTRGSTKVRLGLIVSLCSTYEQGSMADDSCKRSACDRCRRQKVRCGRVTADRSCERCQKSKAICRTSDYAPIGSTESPRKRRALQSVQQSNDASSVQSASLSEIGFTALDDQFNDSSGPLLSDFRDVASHFTTVSKNSGPLSTTNQDRDPYIVDLNGDSAAEVWEEIDSCGLHHRPSAATDLGDVSLDELLQSPGVSPYQDIARPTSSQDTVPQADHDLQTRVETWGQPSKVPRPPSFQALTEPSEVQNIQHAYEQAQRSRAQSASWDNVQLYATQILDLNRRLSRRVEARRRHRMVTISIMSTILDRQTAKSRSAASKRFMEALFSEVQTFLAILRRIQSSTASTPSCDRADSLTDFGNSPTPRPRESTSSLSNRSVDGDSTPVRALDFQSCLAIILFYSQIIRAFDDVFQEILGLVRDAARQGVGVALLDFIPEIHIGNFHIGSQPGIQVKCLLHLSLAVLENIENILGIIPTTSDTDALSDGLLGSTQSQGLLEALFDQEDLVYEKGDGTKAVRVKQTIDQICRILDSTQI